MSIQNIKKEEKNYKIIECLLNSIRIETKLRQTKRFAKTRIKPKPKKFSIF
jgi:hypothetical protein